MKQSAFQWILAGLGLLIVSGCGEDVATPGAEIVAPGETTITYFCCSPGFFDQTSTPLEFQVFQPGGDETKPMPGVPIRFYGGMQVVALTSRDGVSQTTGLPQNFLTSAGEDDPLFAEVEADDRGLPSEDVYAVWFVPPCLADPTDPTAAGPDLEVTGSVVGSVGVDSDEWKLTITVQGGTVAQGCIQ